MLKSASVEVGAGFTHVGAVFLMDLPVILLALRSAVARVPTTVEASFFRAVGAPSRLLSFLPSELDRPLLLDLALMTNLGDHPSFLLVDLLMDARDAIL